MMLVFSYQSLLANENELNAASVFHFPRLDRRIEQILVFNLKARRLFGEFIG